MVRYKIILKTKKICCHTIIYNKRTCVKQKMLELIKNKYIKCFHPCFSYLLKNKSKKRNK